MESVHCVVADLTTPTLWAWSPHGQILGWEPEPRKERLRLGGGHAVLTLGSQSWICPFFVLPEGGVRVQGSLVVTGRWTQGPFPVGPFPEIDSLWAPAWAREEEDASGPKSGAGAEIKKVGSPGLCPRHQDLIHSSSLPLQGIRILPEPPTWW